MRAAHRPVLFALALALPGLACDKPAPEPAPEPAPAPVAEEPAAPAPKDRATLIVGAQPALPPPVAKAAFGATAEATAKSLPGLDGRALVDPEDETLRFFLTFAADEAGGGLRSISVELADTRDAARELLVARWGEPQADEERSEYWFGPEAGVRVTLAADSSAAVFSAYTPVRELIGTAGEGETLGFEADAPLRGLALEALEEPYGDRLRSVPVKEFLTRAHGDEIKGVANAGKDGWPKITAGDELLLELPPAEFGTAPISVLLFVTKKDKIGSYRVIISADKRYAATEDVLAALAARFGEPKEKKGWKVYAKGVRARADNGRVELRVG